MNILPTKPVQVVVITGASAGVGRAAAHAFASEGARIALIARNRQALEEVKREVEERGGQALVLPLDIADADAVEAAAMQIEENLGAIEVWVNNAMVSVFSPIKQMTPDEFRRVTEVTYLGYVYGTLAALKRMLPRDRGVIVQVGSALAYRGIPLQSAYCAAKHAIQGFCDSLRCELIHDYSNVRITMLQMPALNTPQFEWVKSRLPRKAQPVPPVYQPQVAADAIVWASHHPRREVWVGMPTVKAVLVNKIVPGLLDHYLARKGYEGQQFDGPDDPKRPDNLWETIPGKHRVEGRFGDCARSRSLQLWATKRRGWLLLATTTCLGILLAALFKSRDWL